VEAFWTFWPAFQRWAESQTPTGEASLTPQRTRILALLQERGPQIMSGLKTELGVTATNITALVDALESDGLVTRKAHPTDRRATLIEITPKAEYKLMKKDCEGYRERVAEVFGALSEAERRELLRLMDKLQTRLETQV
jgi:DNA-binding MarR family transcriptional regulator